jgi:hypothetical protein
VLRRAETRLGRLPAGAVDRAAKRGQLTVADDETEAVVGLMELPKKLQLDRVSQHLPHDCCRWPLLGSREVRQIPVTLFGHQSTGGFVLTHPADHCLAHAALDQQELTEPRKAIRPVRYNDIDLKIQPAL